MKLSIFEGTDCKSALLGIVSKAYDYIYSSASKYVDDLGLLTIKKVANPVVDVLNLNNFTK